MDIALKFGKHGNKRMDCLLKETKTVWERLKEETKPIILYGMGDGAQKILDVFKRFNIQITDIFASDEFVRGHSFAGFRVKRLSEIQAAYPEFLIVLGFASQRPEVLTRFYELDDRYDVVAPDVPVAGDGLFDLDFYKKYENQIQQVYSLWEDERSKQVYQATLNYKISGKLRYLRQFTDKKAEAFTEILKPKYQEIFVDLGAYNGDTIREWLTYTDGNYEEITALEPDEKNYKKLEKYVEKNLNGRVNLYHAAAWDKNEILQFSAKAGRNSALGTAKVKNVQGVSVDEILQGKQVTAIKFDIEGSEYRAIEGAKETIKTWKPKLNMALYHRNEDLFSIPLQLYTLCPAYRFYLRHHPYVPSWDTNLYAVYPD